MYIPLYVKSSYSLLNSLIDIKQLIKQCIKYNINTIALTDTNMYGTMEFYKECTKNNIKPIIGLEINIDNNKILMYAKNYNGYQYLTKIVYIQNTKELEYNDLTKTPDIICIIPYQYKEIYEQINKLYKTFIGYTKEEQIDENSIYINEVLSLSQENIQYIKYLYLIKDGKKIDEIDNYYIDPSSYLMENITNNPISQKNMEYIKNECNIEFKFNKDLLPKYESNYNDKEYLKNLAQIGLTKRLNNKVTKEYSDRLTYELDIIDKMGFNSYFLVVWDFVKYSKKNNILVGPGRGSAAGSLVSYSLGITDIDPIKYNLYFERFLNIERVTMPDIDIDFDSDKRNEVVEYVINKYGKTKAVPIITFTTLGGKQVVRDMGRIFDTNTSKLDMICKYIGFNKTLIETYNETELKDIINKDEELKKLYDICTKLEGLKRQISIHAAGVIISNEELYNYIPLQKYDDYFISGYSMEHLEELGLLKMDFLGLKNLTLIKNVLNSINKDILFNSIPLDDTNTYNIFKEALTSGVFQFESDGMRNFLRKLKPNNFEDLTAAIALFRPGPASNIDKYIDRKYQREDIDYIHKDLEEILKPTYGIIIYQEQIMKIANIMAGYTLGEADILRRAMSKKIKELLQSQEEQFIDRSIKRGYTYEVSKKVFDLILLFANYGFNRAHSVSYAMIAYKIAYLKTHYSKYFMANLLTNVIGSDYKTKEYILEAKALDINILKPSINDSNYEYKICDLGIVFSLATIRNVGTTVSRQIINERNKGLYIDFFDFVKRNYGKAVNKKTLESLIDADCFSEFGYNHKTLKQSIDLAINYAEIASVIDESIIDKPIIESIDEYSNEELTKKELEVFGFYLTNHPVLKYRSKYSLNTTKIKENFDKIIELPLYMERIKQIDTKNKQKMAFITASDEYGEVELITFPNVYEEYAIHKFDTLLVTARVEKRLSRYQLIVLKIQKI